MKTKLVAFILSFFLIYPFSIFSTNLVAPSKIIISYNKKSIYPFSYLRINHSFLGRIYRGTKKTFYFQPDEKIAIALYRKNEITITNLEIKPGKTYKINLRLHLYSKEEIPSDNLIIFLEKSSNFKYAYIAIDKKHYGFIRRDKKRHFFISTGEHIITVYRFGTKEVQKIVISPDKRTKLRFSLRK